MSVLLQPGFLFLFAVVGFFAFLAMSAKEDHKIEVPMMTRWIIVGICVVIATFGVFTALQRGNGTSSKSGTEATRVTAR
jgi:heme/copper-type cytochrome/quinol oxidase subunit 4